MKNKFTRNLTKLGITLAVAFGIITAQAQTPKSGSLTNGANLIYGDSAVAYTLQVMNRDAAAAILTIYDNSSATSTNTVKTAITTYLPSRATNTSTFTNAIGRVETNNYVYLTRASTVTAAVTNEAYRVYRISVPASSSILVTPPDGYSFTFGYQAHWTGTNADYNTVYRSLP